MTPALQVACVVPTFNAGDTTRGIEVARALVDAGARRGRPVQVTFVAPQLDGPTYAELITRAGFELELFDVKFDEATVASFMKADHDATEFVTDFAVAREIVESCLRYLRARKPSLVIYGFIPPAGMAAQILGIPAVAYLPFPMHGPWVRRHMLKDLPDPLENRLTVRLPHRVRQVLTRLVSLALTGQGFFTQPTFAAAGKACGWREPRPSLFTMLAADLEIVIDLPAFFQGQEIGPRCRVTGPLFSRPARAPLEPRVRELFSADKPRKVFLSMGSSGEKPYLLEAIAAIAAMDVHAVAVVPPSICSLSEVTRAVRIPPNVYLTDAFVPAHEVNSLADVAVIHGGQGTVQTALHSGTPVVGVGMQAEQCSNLDNLVHRGAGIRIPRRLWTAGAVREAVTRVLANPSYRESARRLQQSAQQIDGWRNAGDAMWQIVDSASRDVGEHSGVRGAPRASPDATKKGPTPNRPAGSLARALLTRGDRPSLRRDST